MRIGIILIVLLALVYVAAIVACLVSERLRRRAESLRPFLNLFGLIAVMVIFLQFYMSISQFNEKRDQEARKERIQTLARLKSLEKELIINQDVAKWLIGKEKEMELTKAIPQNEFHLIMLEEILRTGEVQDINLAYILLDTYHRALLSNERMRQLGFIRCGQALQLEDEGIKRRSELKLRELSGLLLEHAAHINDNISSVLSGLQSQTKKYEEQ